MDKSYRNYERIISFLVVVVVIVVLSNLSVNLALAKVIQKKEVNSLSLHRAKGPNNRVSIGKQKPPFAKGELIVKYKQSVVSPVEQILAQQKSFAEATVDKSRSLDELHSKYQVRSARPVFRISHSGQVLTDMDGIRRSQKNRLQALQNRYLKPSIRRASIHNLPELSHIYVVSLGRSVDIEEAVSQFSADPHVEYAQPNYTMEPHIVPNDPFYSSSGSWGQTEDDLWGLKIINAAAAWDQTQAEGAVVAIVDTGVDFSHPDLVANRWINTGEIVDNGIDDDGNGYIDDIDGWNFYDGDNNVNDGYGHGTHVAGTVAAVGNNSIGIIGVAPQAKLMALKGFGDFGAGSTSALSAGIKYAADNGADIINNSWGCTAPCPNNPIAEDAVRYAHGLGAVVIFSAGNNYKQDVANYSPQNIGETITVGSSTQLDKISSFSNIGVDLDVVAPGGGEYFSSPADSSRNVLSLKSATCNGICQSHLIVANNYLRSSGTSMAAPHVSGVAALVVSQHPAYSPGQVKQVIRLGADDLGSIGFDGTFGYGRLNALTALNQPAPLDVMISDTIPVFNSNTSEIQITGLASGADFDRWELEYGMGDAPTVWTEIVQSMGQAPTTGLLHTWDVSIVPDGIYTLRLKAWNGEQQTYEDRQRIVIDQVHLASPSQADETPFRASDTIEIIGTARPADFLNYSIRIEDSNGNSLLDPAVTLVNGGLQPVYDGLLASWDTTRIGEADHYILYLDVHLSGGETTTEAAKVIVDPAYHPGWPKVIPKYWTGSNSYWNLWHHVMVADVTSAGEKAIVLGYGNNVNLIDHNGNSFPGWPQTISGDGFNMSPAVGDITGDGVPEIVAVSVLQDVVYVWDKDGTQLPGWPQHLGLKSRAAAIEDIDQDGINDIVITGDDGSINVIDAQGNSLPGWPQIVEQTNIRPWLNVPSVGDVNGDGANDVVVTVRTKPRNIYVFHGDGTLMAGWPRAVEPNLLSAWRDNITVLGDLDSDGDMEIITAGEDGFVHVLQQDGTYLSGWPKQLSAAATGTTLGDINNDGRLEVLVATNSIVVNSTDESYIHALNRDGMELDGWPVVHNGTRFDPPIVADIDNDGQVEIVAAQYDGNQEIFGLTAYHSDGSLVAGFPKPTVGRGSYYNISPLVSDLDDDGALEMAWIDSRYDDDYYLYLWDLPASVNSKAPWSMYKNSSQLTATNADSDNDSIENKLDNCLEKPNTNQRDVDADGYGNLCDPDFSNDGTVNATDLGYMKINYFSSDPLADLDGDGFVNAVDFGILKSMFFGPPGPSGVVSGP